MLHRPALLCASLISLLSALAQADPPATLPATQPTTAPAIIKWDQAKDHIGQDAVVTGPVIGSHDFGNAAVLNIGLDYPDRERFTVYLPAEKRKGIPVDLYQGKTIAVTGALKLFHHIAEIEADAAHITLVQPPTSAATTQP